MDGFQLWNSNHCLCKVNPIKALKHYDEYEAAEIIYFSVIITH